ncbi:hypothetical protein QP185_00420 [Sphingomonas aerolata]|uniref:hypothetical protein n=1 Tax=Sphingomonas aerolata TaxID=185951 RepID=UPI0030613D44
MAEPVDPQHRVQPVELGIDRRDRCEIGVRRERRQPALAREPVEDRDECGAVLGRPDRRLGSCRRL